MKMFWKPLVKMALYSVAKKLKTIPDRDIKKYAAMLNEKIDIPQLNEETEARILYNVLKGIIDSASLLIDKLL